MWQADPQKGLWLIPTRRRPRNVKRFCEALVATKTSTRGVFLIQKGELLDPNLVRAYNSIEMPAGWCFVPTEGDSQGDKLREVVELYINGDWVGLAGDDQIVQTEHWDLKIIEWLKGWNFVTCHDDGWQVNETGPNNILQSKGRFCGAPCWSGELLRTVGYIFPPPMNHIYLDDVWEELALHTGCWSFEKHARPDVVVAHIHYQRGMAEKDETYTLAYDRFAQIDHPIWINWRRHQLPVVAEKVRQFMARLGAS